MTARAYWKGQIRLAPVSIPVDHDEIVKGFELSKGNYVPLDEEEIEAVGLESKRPLELVQFGVPRKLSRPAPRQGGERRDPRKETTRP